MKVYYDLIVPEVNLFWLRKNKPCNVSTCRNTVKAFHVQIIVNCDCLKATGSL